MKLACKFGFHEWVNKGRQDKEYPHITLNKDTCKECGKVRFYQTMFLGVSETEDGARQRWEDNNRGVK